MMDFLGSAHSQTLIGLAGVGVWLAIQIGAGFMNMRRQAGSRRIELPHKRLETARLLSQVLAKPGQGTLLGAASVKGMLGYFGRGTGFYLFPEHRERHMQIMGPTRCGKSQLLLALCAQDMAARLPVFFMEAKGDVEDFAQFSKLAALSGRSQDVRYFNPADSKSMTLNPIRPVVGQDAVSVANQVSRAIGREPGGGGDAEYFKSLDYARIHTMCEIFLKTNYEFTLKDAFYYFEFESCRNHVFGLCKDKSLVNLAQNQFIGRNGDTSALTANLRPWITGRLGDLLNSYSPQIRLEDIFEGNRLAYLAISVGHLQVLANSLGRMIVAGLLAVAFNRQRRSIKPGPASIILDEFPEFATPAFATFIATVGSARLWTVFSHQDLGQLRKVIGIDPDVFFSALFSNSSGCKVFFHTPHPDDAELIARALGTYKSIKSTELVEAGFFGDQGTGKKSLREAEEFLAHPNLIKSLPPGVAIAWAHQKEPQIIRTAGVHGLVETRRHPRLPSIQGPFREGLNLARFARRKSSNEKTDFYGNDSGSAAGSRGGA